MSNYDTHDIKSALESRGEVLVQLESDGYPDNVELHLHDTSFYHDENEVVVELADGEFAFRTPSIEAIAIHKQSTADLGL